jgi:hypothetical protein
MASAAVHAGADSSAEGARAAQLKLRRDVVSLSIFRYLGKTHCLDSMTAQKPGNFPTEYGILYNQLYPLPRLVSQESLRATFALVEKGLTSGTGYGAKSRSKFVDPISVCHQLYESGSRATTAYMVLVADPKSFHSSQDVDVDKHIRDYLDNYFIKAPD